MSEITEDEVYDAFNGALRDNLKEYVKGKGQYYLQVYIGNKEYKEFAENTRNLVKSIDDSNKLIKDNNNRLVNAKDKIIENKESLDKNTKEQKENTKSQKENTEALKAYGRRFVEAIAEASGVLGGIIVHEMDLTKTISESNTMYQQTAKELNTYADRMGMTLDEYAQFMKENASEFNTLQRQFGDVREATVKNWQDIIKESGATRNEINKGLTTFTKLMTNSGEINNMTSEQFVSASERYINETKLLAKALGVSTDAIMKQTEQAQKQWQYELLMKDPTKQAQMQAALAAGHSMDRILYEVGGIMSEGAAMEMAMSPAARMSMTEWRQRSERGEMQTTDQVAEYAKFMKNNSEYQSLTSQQREYLKRNASTYIYAGDEKLARSVMSDTGEDLDKLLKMAEYEKGKNTANNLNVLASEKLASEQKEWQNARDALLFMGEDLPKHLNFVTDSLSEVKGWYDKLLKAYPDVVKQLESFIHKLAIAGFALNMLITPIKLVWKTATGIIGVGSFLLKLPTKMGKLGTAITSLTNKMPKIGTSISKMFNNIFSGFGSKLNTLKNFLLSTPKMGLGTVALGTSAFALGGTAGYYIADYAVNNTEWGKNLGKNKNIKTKSDVVNSMSKDERARYSQWLQDTGKWKDFAQGYSVEKGLIWDSKKDFDYKKSYEQFRNAQKVFPNKYGILQDNATPQIANSQVQNKADVQAEAKIKAEAEHEAKQTQEEQTLDKDGNLVMPSIKEPKTNLVKMESEEEALFNLREMVGLMKEMTNQLSQLSSQIPMNNYGTVN